MSGMFGDISKVLTEATELKRAVLILNVRIESLTLATDRNSALLEDLLRELRNRLPHQPAP
jgi:hypothetical protein